MIEHLQSDAVCTCSFVRAHLRQTNLKFIMGKKRNPGRPGLGFSVGMVWDIRLTLDVEDALIVLESVMEKSYEWGCGLWIANSDLSKAFDQIENDSLLAAFRQQGIPKEYVQLLLHLCKDQRGNVEGSAPFPIRALFCSMLDWKVRSSQNMDWMSAFLNGLR